MRRCRRQWWFRTYSGDVGDRRPARHRPVPSPSPIADCSTVIRVAPGSPQVPRRVGGRHRCITRHGGPVGQTRRFGRCARHQGFRGQLEPTPPPPHGLSTSPRDARALARSAGDRRHPRRSDSHGLRGQQVHRHGVGETRRGATEVHDQTRDLRLVETLLGHASLATTLLSTARRSAKPCSPAPAAGTARFSRSNGQARRASDAASGSPHLGQVPVSFIACSSCIVPGCSNTTSRKAAGPWRLIRLFGFACCVQPT
jgi:hypothetical protein